MIFWLGMGLCMLLMCKFFFLFGVCVCGWEGVVFANAVLYRPFRPQM